MRERGPEGKNAGGALWPLPPEGSKVVHWLVIFGLLLKHGSPQPCATRSGPAYHRAGSIGFQQVWFVLLLARLGGRASL